MGWTSGSQSVVRELKGSATSFLEGPWIFLCHGNFDVSLLFNERNDVFLQVIASRL
jgi:hypothetical protein